MSESKKNSSRLIGVSLGAAAIVLGAGLYLHAHTRPVPVISADTPPLVGVTTARRANLSRKLEIAAEFRPFQEIDVYAKEAGYVKSIQVDYGSHVHAGQLLATLEIPELADQLDQAQAALLASRQQVTRAQDDLVRARSAYHDSHLAYTRLQGVMKSRPDLVAQQDVDNALAADQEASAQVSADQARLAAAKANVVAAKAKADRVKVLDDYSRIYAPFDGVITKRYADTGAMLQAGIASHVQAMPLVRLAENQMLRLVIPVPEADVARIHLGESVAVRVPALNRTFQGKVARFSDQLDLATRTMHTEVDVPNPGLVLIPGMYAYADLMLDKVAGAVSVPVQALLVNHGRNQVWIVDGQGHARLQDVMTGLQTPNAVQILSGVNPGDQVVLSGRSGLHNGETVRPKLIAAEKFKPQTGD